MSAPTTTSAATSAAPSASASREILTATPRRVLRRRGGWIVVAVIVLLAVIALLVIHSSSTASQAELDVTNPAPQGARALAQVLGQQGVHVVATDTLEATRQAVSDSGSDVTVLLYDPQSILTSDDRSDLLRLNRDVVAVEPGLLALSDLIPSVGLAGTVSGTFHADCDVPAARTAGTVVAQGDAYRLLSGADGVTGCLKQGGLYGLVQTSDIDRTVTVLGLTTALENGQIASHGDAALALSLLGAHHTLVWFIPTFAQLQSTGNGSGTGQTLADVTPVWVFWLMVLLGLVGIAAIVWRGRRFGPVVVENLPVVVRASETMEGRARLYSKADARLRALDALRVGTVTRLARQLGLPRSATVEQVVDAVTGLLGRDRTGVALMLIDHVPSTDSELVHLSDQLLTLEADVTRAIAR